MDIPNEIAKSGHIYFPEFCKLVLDRFRQIIKRIELRTILVGMNQTYRRGGTEDDLFRQNMFKVSLNKIFHRKHIDDIIQMMCGTDPFPKDFKAKKYRQARSQG